MPKNSSDDLFMLIKSMSSREKQYFMSISGEISSGKQKGYIKLFDSINRQSAYDEKKIHDNQSGYLAQKKKNLQELILKSLNNFRAKQDPSMRLNLRVQYARILTEKRLYGQALKLLRSLEKEAEEEDAFEMLFRIYEQYEGILIQGVNAGIRPEEIFFKRKHTMEHFIKYLDLRKQDVKILFHELQATEVRSGSEFAFYENIEKDIAVINEEILLSGRSRFLYYRILVNICFAKVDDSGALFWLMKMISYMEGKKLRTARDVHLYTDTLNVASETYLSLKKYAEAEEMIRKIRKVIDEAVDRGLAFNHFLPAQMQSDVAELEIFIYSGRFEEGIRQIPFIKELLTKYEDVIYLPQKIIAHLIIGYICFIVGKSREAQEEINILLHGRYPSGLREDVFIAARLLNILIQTEKGDVLMLESSIRSTYRVLLKKQNPYKFERYFLEFVRRLSLRSFSPADLQEEWKKLYHELREVLSDRFEKQALYYIDFLSWLESKITGRPFRSIVREKAMQNKSKQDE